MLDQRRSSRPACPVAPDADAVRAVVQHTFDGLAAHGGTMLAAVILPDANFQRWGADSTGTWRTISLSGSAFTSRLGQPGPAYLERTWEADVRVDGDVAVFSAPYDLGRTDMQPLRLRRHHLGAQRRRRI